MRYAYYPDGNVSNITIWDEGDVSKDLYLLYAPDRTLWLAIWQEWDGEEPPAEPVLGTDLRVTGAWEFLYDSGRERYLARHWEFDPNEPGYWKAGEHGETWTDYLGPQPYVDYTIESGTPPVIEEQMRYLAGFGVHAQGSAGVPPAGGPVFLHGDLTRSTMMTTDTSATVLSRVAYSAFGDVVTPDGQGGWRVGFPAELGTRYQYDGGWGYESGLISLFGEDETLPPVTLQHVGWRWYQPSIGRFIQRDPIGLAGGLNVYAYCDGDPVACADPLGKRKVGRYAFFDRRNNRILVHVYDEPTWEWWWDGPRYVRTIVIPVKTPPPGTTCTIADDAAEAGQQNENDWVKAIIRAAEEGEEAAKENARRWGTKGIRRR